MVGKIRGGGSRWSLQIRGRGVGFEVFRLLLSWVVGQIRGGGVVDKVSKFEGGRIRRISSDFMGYPNPRGPGMRSRGPTVGPGGARARARGGQDWGQGGPGLGPGGAMAPLAPPLATGLGIIMSVVDSVAYLRSHKSSH